MSGISSSNGTAVAYQYDLRGLLNRASDLIKQSGIGVTYTDTGNLFSALVDKIIVEDAGHIMFLLKNGLKLREEIERIVR